jgi:threonylcarbamoyladenosine tRNA methylthiotransferase MtaB
MARGKSKNPDIGTLINEASVIASGGVREIVLTGVNIGDFGKSTGETFYSLLKELIKVKGIERYRISSIEPNLLTDEIIDLASASSKILSHFHIPLQSGSNNVLRLMRRRYKREIFAERIKRIREVLPQAGIGADVIVGFPGETAAEFQETYNFLEGLPLSYLHVFTFSERPGTVAAKMPDKVTHGEKESRSKKLVTLSGSKHLEFLKLNSGHVDSVLFERTKSSGMITGYTGNYIRVEYPWQTNLSGQIKKVLLNDISYDGRMNIELLD